MCNKKEAAIVMVSWEDIYSCDEVFTGEGSRERAIGEIGKYPGAKVHVCHRDGTGAWELLDLPTNTPSAKAGTKDGPDGDFLDSIVNSAPYAYRVLCRMNDGERVREEFDSLSAAYGRKLDLESTVYMVSIRSISRR